MAVNESSSDAGEADPADGANYNVHQLYNRVPKHIVILLRSRLESIVAHAATSAASISQDQACARVSSRQGIITQEPESISTDGRGKACCEGDALSLTRFNFRHTSRIKNTTPRTSTAHINKTTYCSALLLLVCWRQQTGGVTRAGRTGYRVQGLSVDANLELPLLQARERKQSFWIFAVLHVFQGCTLVSGLCGADTGHGSAQ